MKNTFLLCLLLLLFGCNSKSELEKEIEAIPVDVTIERFDKVFAEASIYDLPDLKTHYRFFFPARYHDSIWIRKMQDTLQKELETEVLKKFPNSEKLEEDLTSLFQHIKYYEPSFVVPAIFTTTSDVDYRNKIYLNQGLLIIALDTYLGGDHYFYQDINRYIAKNMEEEQIVQDIASEVLAKLISPIKKRTLLSEMIFYGKELYAKELWLPKSSDAEKIGYTEDELKWAQDNEAEIWRYFVENEFLYSTNSKLSPRFINPAPFSKFYLEIDNESPGMIGRYLGWQIVRSYMENTNTTFQQLMIADTDEIFNQSKYKPKK